MRIVAPPDAVTRQEMNTISASVMDCIVRFYLSDWKLRYRRLNVTSKVLSSNLSHQDTCGLNT